MCVIRSHWCLCHLIKACFCTACWLRYLLRCNNVRSLEIYSDEIQNSGWLQALPWESETGANERQLLQHKQSELMQSTTSLLMLAIAAGNGSIQHCFKHWGSERKCLENPQAVQTTAGHAQYITPVPSRAETGLGHIWVWIWAPYLLTSGNRFKRLAPFEELTWSMSSADAEASKVILAIIDTFDQRNVGRHFSPQEDLLWRG